MPTDTEIYEGLQQVINQAENRVWSSPAEMIDYVDNIYHSGEAAMKAEQNGHMDAATSEETLVAANSASRMSKVGAGVGIALMLSTTAGLFAQAASNLHRLPGPFRHISIPFLNSSSALMRAARAMSRALAEDEAKLLRNHLVVHNWAQRTILKQIAGQHGGGTTGKPSGTFVNGSVAPKNGPVTRDEITTINTLIRMQNRDIHELNRRVNAVNLRVSRVEHALSLEPHTLNVPRSVFAQLDNEDEKIARLQQTHQQQQEEITKLQTQVAAVDQTLRNLTGQVTGLGTVTTTWADIEKVLEGHITVTETRLQETNTKLNTALNQLGHLAALGILLQPGVRGLRTLRLLEDRPCLCKKPDLSQQKQSDILAWYEFISNG